MLTFIDGEPLKAGLLLRGSTVFQSHALLHSLSYQLLIGEYQKQGRSRLKEQMNL